ncbi:hypothetical protein IFM89_019770 [Coptis chinensis]|uniref:Guanosine nucleotide diphosphate dissociation inhibitor n=1 Tax=Coptis chinensis TaxID=261450 RepID=A0A835LYT8_9MAGN|nr:hypothetical protein IFM89_019770 [Coptis chinensis]
MDRNDYYGGESSSLNLVQLWKRFRGDNKPPEQLGSSKEYNADMIPKFMMANGALVRVLIHTDVTKYLNFKAVDGSFVYNKSKDCLRSAVLESFFIYVQDYEDNDPKSHEGLDLTKVKARDIISKYGLDDNTVDFIGHALALHIDDSYLDEPALDFIKRMKVKSLARFEGGSPYIYPLYGLGELPQAFARLSVVYGGTYMLNKPECKVEFDANGKAFGVTSEGETAKCKKVVCDPSYLPDKIILLKEGMDTSQGKPQTISNINACTGIADVVRTTLGPRGMDKLIRDDKGNATISNDGATIMKLFDVVHPTTKILVDIAKSQDSEAISKIKELATSIEGKSMEEKKSLLAKCATTTLSSKLFFFFFDRKDLTLFKADWW